MDLGLTDKVVMITGGSRGLGAASARLFCAEGARVALVARSLERMKAVVEEVKHAGHAAPFAHVADLTQERAADDAAEAILRQFGRIDVLVSCAGASQGGLFRDISDSVWRDSFELKFMGAVRALRAVLPIMKRQQSGRVVLVAGNTGRQPEPRMLPGAAANAALLALTRGLAEEVAREGIVINAVNPGPTRTERWTSLMGSLAARSGQSVEQVEAGYIRNIPLGRLGEPAEIARHIAYLASDAAGNMTGACITADGGATRAI